MARVSMLGGRRVEQYNSPNAGGTMSGHRGVVLHIAEGTYRGTISWQNNPNQRYASGQSVTTCSTWVVGKSPGEWAQMVDSGRIAWCQRDGSRTWLSIELAGYAPAAPTAWQVEACAQLLAWAHRTHGVPVAIADHPGERGLGHHSMDREWAGEEWGHDACPGSGVIAAKAAIVARARQILAGEDDGVSAEDVTTGLAATVPWASAGIADWAKRGGVGPKSARALVEYTWRDLAAVRAEQAAAAARDAAILAAVTGGSAEQVLAAVAEQGERTRAELAQLAAADAQRDAELRALVERGLSGELAADEVVRLIGERLVATGGMTGSGSA